MSHDPTAYFNSILDKRALLVDFEDLAGIAGETVSLETKSDLLEESIYNAIQENFPVFYKTLGMLSKDDQETILSYYLLHKPQWCLAKIKRSTQTDCSFRLRMAIRKLGACLLFGVPEEHTLHTILTKLGYENFTPEVSTSKVVHMYKKYRSFKIVAHKLSIPKPVVRKTLSHVSKNLLELEDNHLAQAVGAYIFGLLDRVAQENPNPTSKRATKQVGNQLRVDPKILGSFRIRVDDPDFDYVLVSRANI